MENLRNEIISLIQQSIGSDTAITGNSIIKYLYHDSLDVVLFIGELEDRYCITIDETDYPNLEKIDDVVELIQYKKSAI